MGCSLCAVDCRCSCVRPAPSQAARRKMWRLMTSFVCGFMGRDFSVFLSVLCGKRLFTTEDTERKQTNAQTCFANSRHPFLRHTHQRIQPATHIRAESNDPGARRSTWLHAR